jgi:hypothetical protein
MSFENSPGKEGGESPTEKSSVNSPGESSPGAIHNSPPSNLFTNLESVEERPSLMVCLDFIVNQRLGPEFQRYLDEREVSFSIEEWYNK